MRYLINQISNRDAQLLHTYRILRQPSDYLSPIFRDDVQSTQILSGMPAESDFKGEKLYRFDLALDILEGKIPYLEFEPRTAADFRNLQLLAFLEDGSLFGIIDRFEQPVDVSVYFVDSLGSIEATINRYLDDLGILNDSLDALRDKFLNKSSGRVAFSIGGRDQNLIQFKRQGDSLSLTDSHYKLVTTLVGQTLVNPSQETLSLIPKILSHDLLITITDNKKRILQGFSGFTIFITGNGNWVFRDIKSTINIASALKTEVQVFNCSLLYLRSNLEVNSKSNKIDLNSLFLHRTNCIIKDGSVRKLKALGQSTVVVAGGTVHEVSYLGAGCYFDSYTNNPTFRTDAIFGTIYSHGASNADYAPKSGVPCLSYKSGHRIGFLQGQTDFELLPTRVASTDINDVHIHDWTEQS